MAAADYAAGTLAQSAGGDCEAREGDVRFAALHQEKEFPRQHETRPRDARQLLQPASDRGRGGHVRQAHQSGHLHQYSTHQQRRLDSGSTADARSDVPSLQHVQTVLARAEL